MALFFFIAHKKFQFHAQPQTGPYFFCRNKSTDFKLFMVSSCYVAIIIIKDDVLEFKDKIPWKIGRLGWSANCF